MLVVDPEAHSRVVLDLSSCGFQAAREQLRNRLRSRHLTGSQLLALTRVLFPSPLRPGVVLSRGGERVLTRNAPTRATRDPGCTLTSTFCRTRGPRGVYLNDRSVTEMSAPGNRKGSGSGKGRTTSRSRASICTPALDVKTCCPAKSRLILNLECDKPTVHVWETADPQRAVKETKETRTGILYRSCPDPNGRPVSSVST